MCLRKRIEGGRAIFDVTITKPLGITPKEFPNRPGVGIAGIKEGLLGVSSEYIGVLWQRRLFPAGPSQNLPNSRAVHTVQLFQRE